MNQMNNLVDNSEQTFFTRLYSVYARLTTLFGSTLLVQVISGVGIPDALQYSSAVDPCTASCGRGPAQEEILGRTETHTYISSTCSYILIQFSSFLTVQPNLEPFNWTTTQLADSAIDRLCMHSIFSSRYVSAADSTKNILETDNHLSIDQSVS